MRDNGAAGQHSVTNSQAYRLYTIGANCIFEGGGGDDVLIPLGEVTYNADTHEATVQVAASAIPLIDGEFQVRVSGSDLEFALRDVTGNALSGGADMTAGFVVNRVGPVNLTAAALTGDEGQALTLVASFNNPGSHHSHSAIVDWGDGVTEPVAATFAAGHGLISAQHLYPDNRSYDIHIEVSDDSLAGVVDPSVVDTTATIANVAPTLTVSVNRPIAGGAPISLFV